MGSQGDRSRAAFEQSGCAWVLCDADSLHVLEGNAAALRVWPGLVEESVAGLFDDRRARGVVDACHEIVRRGGSRLMRDQRIRVPQRRGATDVHLDVELDALRDDSGVIRWVSIRARDVTDETQRHLADELEFSAGLDGEVGRADAVAVTVQEALLPHYVPVLPTLEIAGRCLIADGADPTGGDWCEALSLPGGEVALVVGDVAGADVPAAGVMAGLRAVLAERLLSGASPDEALAALDRFAATVPGAAGTTVCVVVVDPGTGRLRYASAGHTAPIFVDAQGRYSLDQARPPHAGPLGSGVTTYAVIGAELPPGALLLLHSNGASAPDGSGTRLLVRSATQVLAGGNRPGRECLAERACNHALALISPAEGSRDDVVLLAARRVEGGPSFDREHPATRAGADLMREELDTWLAELHPGATDRYAALVAVTELVTNVVEHAYVGRPEVDGGGAAPTVRVHARLEHDGLLDVTVRDHGAWLAPAATRTGRGLALARGLVSSLDLDRSAHGTTVSVRTPLGRPVQVYQERRPHLPATLPFTATTQGGDTLRVQGWVDALDADELRTVLLQGTLGGTVELTVDLTGVRHLSSAAVQVLVEARGWGTGAGGHVELVAAAGSIAARVLDIAGLPFRT